MFLWERFGAHLVPVEFEPGKSQKFIINGVERERERETSTTNLELSWSEVKPEEGRKPLSKLIDAEKSFNFRPYLC